MNSELLLRGALLIVQFLKPVRMLDPACSRIRKLRKFAIQKAAVPVGQRIISSEA